MKITGVLKTIDRVKVACPKDGVHVAGKDGEVKGVRNVMIGDVLVPKGMVGFYYQLDNTYGLKVFMHLPKEDGKMWISTLKYVNSTYNKLRKLWGMGLCPQPISIGALKVSIVYRGKKYKTKAFYIKSEHVCYPPEAWERYGKGYPYDWTCVRHEEHTPKGFKKFVSMAKQLIHKSKLKIDTSFKLGDVVWDINKQRWFLVDAG